MQFLDMDNVTVRSVVEPYLLDTINHPPPSFVDLVSMLLSMDIQCCRSVQQLEQFNAPTLCLIAAKTRDNPKHFEECILKGASVIYLESPGAQSVEQLAHMQQMAEARGVQVFIGYQRLCCQYVQKVRLARGGAFFSVLFQTYFNHLSGDIFKSLDTKISHLLLPQPSKSINKFAERC